MTNMERWQYYMKDFCSPQTFVDWGFYSLISGTLQRRVWLGSNQKKLHPNMYNILTGPAGVGKGMVLGEVANIFRHPKMQKVAPDVVERRKQAMEELGEEVTGGFTKSEFDTINNMKIPIAPNATTYEALCRTLAKSARGMYIELPTVDGEGKHHKKMELHSSILFLLEELGSLFRKHTEDIHTFLCETYDCKDPYEYRTKNQGTDYIKRPCVSLLAGTTPDFLKRVFSSSLLTEGFASRTVFIVAMRNRFRHYETPVFCKEQLDAYEEIVDHVVRLSTITGLVEFTPEALAFNKYWYEKEYAEKVPNAHPKLQPYYARINITHAKLCVAMHYAEEYKDNKITLETAQKALTFLQATEVPMHLALNINNKNPLSEATDDIYKFICANGLTSKKELMTHFYDAMPDPTADIETILIYLRDSGKIEESDKPKHYMASKPTRAQLDEKILGI